MIPELIKSLFSQSKKHIPAQSTTQVLVEEGKNRWILTWPDGSFYDGQTTHQKVFEGHGKLCMENGEFYEGEFLNGKYHGYGKFTFVDKSYYEGEWEDNMKNGIGKQKSYDGTLYGGQYRHGLKNGSGVMEWADGSIYEGKFVDDLMEGFGKIKYSDGSIYMGNWKKGKQNGEGQLVDSKSVYRGNFKDGVKHGGGIWVQKESDTKIQGTWRHGELTGRFLIFQNNNVKSAKIIKDVPNYLTDVEYQQQADQKNMPGAQ